MLLVFAMWLLPSLSAMTENDWGSVEEVMGGMMRAEDNWNCDCWNTTEEQEDLIVDCRCTGEQLTYVPRDLHPGLHTLTLSGMGIRVLRKDSLQPYRNTLQDLTLNGLKQLERIEVGTFRKSAPLADNIKDDTVKRDVVPNIYIYEAPLLTSLPAGLFEGITQSLLNLRIMRSGLEHFPDMAGFPTNTIMHMIDLESNRIKEIRSNSVRVKASQLVLNYNSVESVEGWAFNGSQIAKLSLKGNKGLTKLSSEAFRGLKSLVELDLSDTAITRLPTSGLDDLEVLRIQHTESLTVIPSVYSFKNLKEARLTYSFHCCAFKFPARHDPAKHALHQARLAKMREQCQHDSPAQRSKRSTDLWAENLSSPSPLYFPQSWGPITHEGAFSFGPIAGDYGTDGFVSDQILSDDAGQWHDDPADHGVFHQTTVKLPVQFEAMCGNLSTSSPQIVCHPEPDALNPCEDIMGFTWLRVSVWFVVVTAVVGNLAVLLVLLSNMFDLTVPKFLMCHLAFADLCMGIYLLILAAMDVHSSSVYFNFAYSWQIGAGCQVAGFLTVFASQLSIYTLTILTLERWFAITYAIYLNKRLKLRAAAHIMAAGWMYSLTMAALPLMGISGYSTTSICLPMDTRDMEDVAYLITLLVMNGLAFVVICICYTQIYFSLDARNGELAIAKKMALLVFTDFACWAPIAFFGLTAVAGYPLIDVTRSKILLVFFYPLNSCANPYLYAILTAQYRKDLFVLLARYGLCVRTAQQYKMTYSLGTTNNSNPIPMTQRNVIVVTNTSTINGSVRTTQDPAEVFV